MADGITVDQLAIKIAANADSAAGSIDRLTASLARLNGVLSPVLTKLQRASGLAGRLGRVTSAQAVRAARTTAPISPAIAAIQTQAAPAVSPGAASALTSQATTNGLTKTATVLDRVRTRVSSLTSRLVEMGQRGSKSVFNLGDSFIQLRSKIFFAMFALTAIVGVFRATVLAATDFIETLNLFQVSLRNNLDAANQFVQSMSEAFGLDPERIMRYQSTFFQIAESIGLTNQNAYNLSEILTRLTFDFASLRNMKLEDVFTKLQGVLTGQDRAVRSLGGSIQQTVLQELALELGIDKAVQKMTQAEKTLLRLIAIYRQSAIAQGDMARTLLQPANLMRVLGDQVKITARNIGAIFIPMLQAVLPYIIYFVRAIGMLAASIAKFFGVDLSAMTFSAPDVSFSNTLGDNMERTEGAAQGAAKAVKQMRDYVLGIDELNVLKPEDASAGGGGGGGGGIGGGAGDLTDLIAAMKAEMDKLLDTPFADLMKKIGDKVKVATKALAPFIDALKATWDAFKPFIANVWQGFKDFFNDVMIPLGGWTLNELAVAGLEDLKAVLDWFNKNPKAANALGQIAGALVALGISLKTFKGIGKFLGGLGVVKFLNDILIMAGVAGGGKAALTSGLGKWLGSLVAGGGMFATLAAGIVKLIALLIAFGVGFLIGRLMVKLIPGFEEALEKIGAALDEFGWNLGIWLADNWDLTQLGENVKYWWGIISAWITDQWAQLKFNAVYWWNEIKQAIVVTWENIRASTKAAWEKIRDGVTTPIKDLYENKVKPVFDKIKTAVRKTWDGLKDGLQEAWNAINRIIKSSVNAMIRLINNGPIAAINKIIEAAKAIDKTGLMKGVKNVTTIPYLEAGGSLSGGSVFVAGEKGKAELIGEHRGQTTVMPLENSGFVEAMAAAVYSATVSALAQASQSGGSGDVYLDGRKVGQTLRDNDRRAGIGGSLVRVTA